MVVVVLGGAACSLRTVASLFVVLIRLRLTPA